MIEWIEKRGKIQSVCLSGIIDRVNDFAPAHSKLIKLPCHQGSIINSLDYITDKKGDLFVHQKHGKKKKKKKMMKKSIKKIAMSYYGMDYYCREIKPTVWF